jgi:predicted phage terminase large subunit-like protein
MTRLTPDLITGFVKTVLASGFEGATETPDFHKEMWELCCSPHPLVAIAAPRGYAKTTAVTLSYGLTSLLFRESKYLLILSATIDLANGMIASIKNQLQNNTNIAELFGLQRDEKGDVKFVKDTEDSLIVKMDDGYCFRVVARGAEQKIRGLNWDGTRPDLIICDDLEEDEAVLNKERREKLRNWFNKAVFPMRSSKGKIRMVGTILHMDSLLERRMPKPSHKDSIIEPLKLSSKVNIGGWRSVKYRAHSDDYLHLLWPTRWPKQKLQDYYDTLCADGSPDSYSQEMLNIPLDSANTLFKRNSFCEITDEMHKCNLNYYIAADLAVDQHSKADYTVFMVAGVDEYKRIHIKNVIRERLDPREIVDMLIELQRVYNPDVVGIEEMQVSKAIGPFLREEMITTGVFLNLYQLKHGGKDKIMRTSSIRARMQCNTVFFDKQADWYAALEEECLRFPRDTHDDQVDCLAYLGMLLNHLVEANSPEEQDEENWLDELRTNRQYDRRDGRSNITGY